MNYSFEYIDIILLAMIAGFIFLRLRGILGKRTGFEGKPPPQFEEILKNIDPKIKTKQKENFDEDAQKEFLKGAKIAWGVKSANESVAAACTDDIIDGVWRFLDVKSNEVLCEAESTDKVCCGHSSACFSFNGRQFASADDLQKYVTSNMDASAHTDVTQVKGEYSLNGVRFATSGKLHKYFNSRLSTNNDSGSGVYGIRAISGSIYNFKSSTANSQSFGEYNLVSASFNKFTNKGITNLSTSPNFPLAVALSAAIFLSAAD